MSSARRQSAQPSHAQGKQMDPYVKAALVTVVNYISYSSWTVMNKWQFQRYEFHFPIVITSYQMLFVGVLAHICINHFGVSSRKPLTKKLMTRIIPLGLVRSTDIGFGNAALMLVSVALQQIIKSTIPIYVCILSVLVLRRPITSRIWLTLVPIVGGVALASWGELSTSWLGVTLAVTSCVARAGKAIINDLLLHTSSDEERLDAVQIMGYESPFSGVVLGAIGLVVNGPGIVQWLQQANPPASLFEIILYNSVCSVLMFLNQWSYISIIKLTSGVTCQILMNLKMIILIMISVAIFRTPLRPIHMLGMIIATGGCIVYAMVLQKEQQAKQETTPAQSAMENAWEQDSTTSERPKNLSLNPTSRATI